ncbi:pyocin activator PrtN family protein [Methylobacterium dankookense]|uniref:Pyocin activator protein PrtN n=1 Tax=Methylobacterium dankookense TaxID=560405 RepID=A0A564FSV9_9HYPH|nr:pyocin activator PrtN family protein [Methylobacterium dankookense]GJD57459.1 hypothetical protein IFDJLNFL_3360 [Methylobacterium dankookense]VUF11245.1 hypothetical protein MTDSW087_00922 [Methylobacterium dankookense]
MRQAQRAEAAAEPRDAPMVRTTFLLVALYGFRPLLPIERVARDFFSHHTAEKLVRLISAGRITLPLVRIDASPRCAKHVALVDLARWIDDRAEEARIEVRLSELQGRPVFDPCCTEPPRPWRDSL